MTDFEVLFNIKIIELRVSLETAPGTTRTDIRSSGYGHFSGEYSEPSEIVNFSGYC